MIARLTQTTEQKSMTGGGKVADIAIPTMTTNTDTKGRKSFFRELFDFD